jgi:hypothetical protein
LSACQFLPVRRLITVSLVLVSTFTFAAPVNAAPCDPPISNPILCENTRSGNPSSQWSITGAGDASIQGFATDISYNLGDTVRFKINTPSTNYHLDIYRLGYYGGLGARLVATVSPSVALPQSQPACLIATPSTGLVDCGNWAQSASWSIPTSAVTGVYFAKLQRDDLTGASHVYFVVRDDASHSDLLFQTSDTTWQAYNTYGGNSLYYGGPGTNPTRGYKVSYNRPLTTRGSDYPTGNTRSQVFNDEYPAIRFLEGNGYNVSYFSAVDSDRRGSLIQNHRVFLSVGHDEYWSNNQRANVVAARDAGVSLAFMSGNEIFWKTRWENSIDGSNTSYRTLVSFKETHANAVIDPADPPTWTGTWRDPRFSPPADGGRPENALSGTTFQINGTRNDSIVITSAFSRLRFWRNTSVANLTGSQTVTTPAGTLGSEWDISPDNGFAPGGLFKLSATTISISGQYLLDYGSTYGNGTATHNLTLYRAASGALVFGAGTMNWAWGLDATHDNAGTAADLNMQQATINILADMNTQPGSLFATLVAANGSTDTTLPTSVITAPTPGASFASGSTVAITGTAADVGGVVAAVEVSTDGGVTWHQAVGTTSWSYTWVASTSGTVTIQSRGIDDSGNIQSPVASVTISVSSGGFGNTSAGSSTDSSDSNFMQGSRYTVGTSALSVTSMSVNVGAVDTTPNNLFQVAIYSDSNGVPASLVASSVSGLLVANSWNTMPVTATLAANASYWLMYNTNGRSASVNDLRYNMGAANQSAYNPSGTAFGAWPSAFGTATRGNYSFSIYATYVGSATPTPGPSATSTSTPTAGPSATVTSTPTFGPSATSTWTSTRTPVPPTSTSTTIATATSTSVSGTCPCTTWPASAAPANPNNSDLQAVELGVKLRADSDGFITGVRFYKGSGNTGTHVGSLWSSAGTLLGQATFASETATGWQEVSFASPVAIVANTTYVASYHTNVGHYASDQNGLSTVADRAPLHALASGSSGGNGVYMYGAASLFPNLTFNATNYWVDIVFTPSTGPTPAPPTATPVATNTAQPTATAVATNTAQPTLTSSPAATATPALSPTPGGPTIYGNTHIGATVDTSDSNWLNGSRITIGASPLAMGSMSVYVASVDTAPNNIYQMAIYTDTAGRPGTLVAQTGSGVLTANAWNTLPIALTLNANTSYWLIYNSNGRTATSNNMRMDSGLAGQGAYSIISATFGTWPATFTSPLVGPWNWSIYVSS